MTEEKYASIGIGEATVMTENVGEFTPVCYAKR